MMSHGEVAGGGSGDERQRDHRREATAVEGRERSFQAGCPNGAHGRERGGEDDSDGRAGGKKDGWLRRRRYPHLRLPQEPSHLRPHLRLLRAERHPLPPRHRLRVSRLLRLAPPSLRGRRDAAKGNPPTQAVFLQVDQDSVLKMNVSGFQMFVEEVMDLVELNVLRGSLVGLPGVTGLSTEQRKRLTIAVELVANPSIIFMDEPTSGLDARAAAIVMRAVRNTVDTGRTVVCTIHQPSIDIFEAFDEVNETFRSRSVFAQNKFVS